MQVIAATVRTGQRICCADREKGQHSELLLCNDVGVKRSFAPFDTGLLRTACSHNPQKHSQSAHFSAENGFLSVILPGPAAVLGTLIQLAGVPSFWQTALLSLVRVLAGLLAGTLLGALTAALTCASRWADVLLSPAVRVIRAVPVVSFILFVLLWTRRGLVPVVVSALMVLPVVWGNVSRGIRETDPRLLEQAGALRFSRLKTVRLVYLPSVRPYFLSAVVTSLGLAWKSGVAAEVLCRPAWAVGTQIVQARDYLETPSLFAWTLVVLLLSLALEKLLSALLNRINRRWSP